MARIAIPFAVPAPQPGLRSFIIYDDIPEGCIILEITDDRAAPHLRAGDFAIVDLSDHEPAHGELFAINWESGGKMQVVEARLKPGRYGVGEDGAMVDTSLWFAEWKNMLRREDGLSAQIRWGDGPYLEEHFRTRLAGKIVGIYEPDFRAQLQLAA